VIAVITYVSLVVGESGDAIRASTVIAGRDGQRLRSPRQRAPGANYFALDQGPQTGATRGGNGKLRHRKDAVGQDEDENDAEFDIEHWFNVAILPAMRRGSIVRDHQCGRTCRILV
jgi:hypothetical protein